MGVWRLLQAVSCCTCGTLISLGAIYRWCLDCNGGIGGDSWCCA